MLKISCKAFELMLKHPFSIAKFTRNSTPILLLKLDYEGFIGFGEASMVPYMGESQATAADFLKRIDLSKFRHPFNFAEIHEYMNKVAPGNPAVKAAIDIALNDINGKIFGQSCAKIYGAEQAFMPVTSYTIGIDTPEIIREKVADAEGFKVLKIKLGRDNDKELIQTIRALTDVPLYVDANQGWNDKEDAIDMCHWLHEQGVQLIEQPMDKNNLEGNAWLTERSPIPILADEAVQRIGDMDQLKGAYHGINIKLMKSAGMYEAHQMILKARSFGMNILIGCMSETSIATLAGAALAPLCDWADLDGPWLTKNNPFDDPKMQEGRYILSDLPGLGLTGGGNNLFD